MKQEHLTVGTFATHKEADAAVRALNRAGFALKRLSVIGKGLHSEEQALGYLTRYGQMLHLGALGVLVGLTAGLVIGAGMDFLPLPGDFVAIGPYASTVAGGLEGAVAGGLIGALFGLLDAIGLPTRTILRYRRELKPDKYLVLLDGDGQEALRARYLIADAGLAPRPRKEAAAHAGPVPA